MAPKESKKSRRSIPDDPDKDPWTATQVAQAYGGHTTLAASKGLSIELSIQLNSVKRSKFESAMKAAVNQLFAKEQVQEEQFEDGAVI